MSCCDRMCGADDCARCHPELQGSAECECCGSEHALWEDWYGPNRELCEDCMDKVQCYGCCEWFDESEIDADGLCTECVKLEAAG